MSEFVTNTIICEDDDHEDEHNTTDMQAKYLQSVRSPIRPGRFRIPEPKTVQKRMNVFSQNVLNESISEYQLVGVFGLAFWWTAF